MEHLGSGFLANLDREQRVRYYAWWRKYLFLKRLTGVAGSAFLGCALSVRMNMFFPAAARLLIEPVVLVFAGSMLWFFFLDCPRCGKTFRGWRTAKYFGDECQNCGLTGRELSAIAKPAT